MGGGSEGDRVVYSCVVDASPALYHQVMVWAWTAIGLAEIDPAQLVVHGVDGCDERLARDLDDLGVRWVPVRPFGLGTPMCNKLAQLESEELAAHQAVVLSDCDLAWCAPIEPALVADVPRAKVVDFANPPLDLLRSLYEEAGFADAALGSVSIGGASTYHNNCNGGLYLLSGTWLRRLREPWPRWLRWVLARADRLGSHAGHVFQIAFALAMEDLGARVQHLPVEFNFPTHADALTPVPEAPVRVLHFHRAFDPASGLLRPTGVGPVDAAIARVNAHVQPRLARAWWLPETTVVTGVHGRFRTRRDDHVTRQLTEYGAHTRNELAMVLSFLRPGDQTIDVGAHIGTYTVPFAKTVGPGGRVLSIEPGDHAFARLVENLALNGVDDRVRPFHAVATDRAGSYRAVPAGPDHTSATYYVPEPTAPPSACVRLDDLAAALDPARPLRLLKIDVEGMELSVLRSAERLIRAHRPLLYLEVVEAQLARHGVSVADVARWLSARGYRAFRNVGLRNSTNDEFHIAALTALADGGAFFDCLAIPEERVCDEPGLPATPPPRRSSPLRRLWRRWTS